MSGNGMTIEDQIIQALVRVELFNRSTLIDEEFVQLGAQHTGTIRIEDDGADVEFYWEGGETVMVTDEFMALSGKMAEFLEGSKAIRVGSFILDFVEDKPKYGLTVYRRRELEMP